MVKILIFNEKHGDSYYDASTPEKRAGAFLSILRERNDYGYYYNEPKKEDVTISEEDQAMLDLTEEQIEVLPEELKAYTTKRRSAIKRNLHVAEREYAIEKTWWDALQELLSYPDEEAIKKTYINERNREFNLAEYLVEYRADYEYEGYDFEETRN